VAVEVFPLVQPDQAFPMDFWNQVVHVGDDAESGAAFSDGVDTLYRLQVHASPPKQSDLSQEVDECKGPTYLQSLTATHHAIVAYYKRLTIHCLTHETEMQRNATCVRVTHTCVVGQSLPGLLRHKAYRKRTSGRARWTFPEGFQLAVAMYALVQPAAKSSPVSLNATNNEPLRIESALICQDTGKVLLSVHSLILYSPWIF
jgi:hypothetical protein